MVAKTMNSLNQTRGVSGVSGVLQDVGGLVPGSALSQNPTCMERFQYNDARPVADRRTFRSRGNLGVSGVT